MSDVILVKEEPLMAYEMIEIPVTVEQVGDSRLPIPDIQQLKSDTDTTIIIKAVELITVDVLSRGVIGGDVNAPLTELVKMSLVVYSQAWERGHYIPLLTLNRMATPAGTFPYAFAKTTFNDWQKVDWPKSFIKLSNNTAVVGGNYCIMLGINYVRIDRNA